jgi:hypothetical protein
MIPSWLRFKGDFFNGWEEDGEPVLTKEQKAILKALADPVENKFLYDSWRYKDEVENK